MGIEIKLSKEELQKRILFLGVPMYGGNCTGMFTRSLADLATLTTHWGIKVYYYFLFNESLITRARNYISDEFMRSDATHLLFIDADIGFNAQDVLAMMAMQDPDPTNNPYDILAAPYPKKCVSWEKIVQAVNKGMADNNPNDLEKYVGDYVFNPVSGTNQISITDPVEVLETGTGFMMIRKNTFEKFREAYPQQLYKPDHIRTEHFDGSRQIMAYFDTPICPDTNRYLSEDYMFCIPGNSMIKTEDGNKTIRDIVDNKFNGKVKSINSNGRVSWNNVIDWSTRSNNGKKWVKVNTLSDNRKVGKLICTDDHKIATIKNVFDPTVEYVNAKDCTNLYSIRDIDNANINPLYGKDSLSFMIGTMLGDATISKTGQLAVGHTEKHVEYVKIKQKIFGAKKIGTDSNNRGYSGAKTMHGISLPVNAQTKTLREIMYVDGRKTPINIIDMIDEKALAFWFMDDGSGMSAIHWAGIATYSFTIEENQLLANHLKNKFDLDVTVRNKKCGEKNYPYLSFSTEASYKLFEIISPYVPDCMRYKLGEKFKDKNLSYEYKLDILDYGASYIKEIEYTNDRKDLYDITVENDHSFVANGTFVHNCQWSRKIGMKVWLCPWMKLQHVGSMVFGGSLADLAAIGASATASPELLGKNKKSK